MCELLAAAAPEPFAMGELWDRIGRERKTRDARRHRDGGRRRGFCAAGGEQLECGSGDRHAGGGTDKMAAGEHGGLRLDVRFGEHALAGFGGKQA